MTRLALLAITLAACSNLEADPPQRKSSPPIRFEHDMMVRFHMHQNFDLLRAVERLLIRGKLEDGRRFAAVIGAAPDEPAHGPWTMHAATIRERAAAVARATTLADAIRKTARLGAACGSCHGELGVSPELATPPPLPPDLPTIDARMARHRWAADRLWEGVVLNQDTPWRAGLDVLAAAPLDLPGERGKLARELQRTADHARRPSPGPLTDRGTTYGEILVTCTSCHVPAAR